MPIYPNRIFLANSECIDIRSKSLVLIHLIGVMLAHFSMFKLVERAETVYLDHWKVERRRLA